MKTMALAAQTGSNWHHGQRGKGRVDKHDAGDGEGLQLAHADLPRLAALSEL